MKILISLLLLELIGSYFFSQVKGIPLGLLATAFALLAIETSLYVLPACLSLLEMVAVRLPALHRALVLWLAGCVPTLSAYALGSSASVQGSITVVLLFFLASHWFFLLPPGRTTDAGFMLLMALPIALGLHRKNFPELGGSIPLAFFAQVAWIYTGILVALLLRGANWTGLRYWPHRNHWKPGIVGAVSLLAVLTPLNELVSVSEVRELTTPLPVVLLQLVATFLGMFWVVALAEEFFFRGLLQYWLSEWLRSEKLGLVVASTLFGLAHLGFRSFPNWKFSLLAAVAGLVYGELFRRTRTVVPGMIAHALTNTVWRTFFH